MEGISLFLSSHHVSNMFSSICNGVTQILWLPNLFPKGIPNSTSLCPTSFTQSSPFLTFISELKGRHSILTLNLLFWGTSQVLINYLFLGDGPIKMPHWKKNTWEATHLPNRRGKENKGYGTTMWKKQNQLTNHPSLKTIKVFHEHVHFIIKML